MPARDRRQRPVPTPGARPAGAAAMLVGMALMILALPGLGAALSRIPGDPVLQDLRAGTPVAPAALWRLHDSRTAALRWRADARALAERALVDALRADTPAFGPGTGATGAARLRAAERDLTAALGAAPADPYTWTRLALIRWRLGRPAASVQAALDAARITGPHNRRLRPLQHALAARLSGAPDG